MDIVVCVKRVPDTAEEEVHIDSSERDVDKSKFSFAINEADNYAVEEAILLKEKHEGTVTVISVGPPDADQVIRMALAKGGDTAIRLGDEAFADSDPYAIAKILHSAIKDLDYDLVFTGCMANDDGFMAVGVILAEMLGIPHAALVKSTEVVDGKIKVQRELEGGLLETLEMDMPALCTLQTGINEPRYASFKGIRAASKKEIKVMGLADTGLSADDVGQAGSHTVMEKFSMPVVGELAEIIEGDASETSAKLADILKEKGLV